MLREHPHCESHSWHGHGAALKGHFSAQAAAAHEKGIVGERAWLGSSWHWQSIAMSLCTKTITSFPKGQFWSGAGGGGGIGQDVVGRGSGHHFEDVNTKGTVTQVLAAIWDKQDPCSKHPVSGMSGVGAALCPMPLPTECPGMLCPQSSDTHIRLDGGDLRT